MSNVYKKQFVFFLNLGHGVSGSALRHMPTMASHNEYLYSPTTSSNYKFVLDCFPLSFV